MLLEAESATRTMNEPAKQESHPASSSPYTLERWDPIYPPAYPFTPTADQHPITHTDNLSPSSTIGLLTSATNTKFHDTIQAPDSISIKTPHYNLQTTLTEATLSAVRAERKNAELLKSTIDLERHVHDLHTENATLSTTNTHLTISNRALQADLAKLQKYTKECEEASGKAQREAENAKEYAEHQISSQHGRLKKAEQRYEIAEKELKEWKKRYGARVQGPAEEKLVLQRRVAEWQSKAEKGQIEAVKLKAGLGGRGKSSGADEAESSAKVEGGDPGRKPTEEDASTMKPARHPNSRAHHPITTIADAEAKAAKFKAERDALNRLLQEEMTRNAKMAEALVFRNARLAESSEGLALADREL